MKVLLLIDAWFPFVGGAQIRVKNLLRILKEKYKIEFLVLHSPHHNIFIRFLWSFWVVPQALWLQRQHKFNLIHAHAYWSGIPGKILSKILHLPIVFTVHGSNLLDLKVQSLRAWLEKIILTQIQYDQIITVASNFLKYKNINKNITVIANGVDISEFKMKSKKLKRKKPKNSLILLTVARNDPVKGLKYLKKAFNSVKKDYPQVQLKIIQSSSSRRQLVGQYLQADIFILPSLSEGQPLTLLEAWAAKLPVIATKVGDNPLMVKDGVNGYLVNSADSQVLTQAILKMIKNKQRRKFGQKGYQLVKKDYSWQKCAQKVFSIYQKTWD